LDDVERRGLPAEFALLPYVESNYAPVRGSENGPSGIWQLMPRTARDRGIRIERDYDGRLDLVESTRVALDLIERYDREFGDWRLATMAFNAGEFRIKRALTETPANALDAQALSRLKLSATTHQHLTRMLALACVVDDPARFGVTLPEPDADDALGIVAVDGPIDLRVAANFAGLSFEELQQLNAAHLGERSASVAPHRLVLPRAHLEPFSTSSQAAPLALRSRWRSMRVPSAVPLEDVAQQVRIDAQSLAVANGVERTARLPSGATLLVPEHALGGTHSAPVMQARTTHTVASGDTLSAIARRYGVRIGQLVKWNSLRLDGVLRPGSRLRIGVP
ncbi:MAG: LysM peptidoglycan-binding domain-containing protein, partial [Dokdonella sp.]